jgi:uncharacterized protein
VKLVYSSDLHGQIELYRELLELARAEAAAALILGGDLLPHTTRRETAIATQRAFVADALAPLLRRFVAGAPGPRIYAIPGNDDWAGGYAAVAGLAAKGLLIDLHGRSVELAPGTWLAGSGLIGLTPFAIKDYERLDTADTPPSPFGMALGSAGDTVVPLARAELLGRPTLADELERLAALSDPRRTIYALHVPPRATQLDRRTGGTPIGSVAVAEFIQRHAPPLTLHGHVHESPEVSGGWIERIGATIAINPGQGQRGLHAVVVDSADVAGTARNTVYPRPPKL